MESAGDIVVSGSDSAQCRLELSAADAVCISNVAVAPHVETPLPLFEGVLIHEMLLCHDSCHLEGYMSGVGGGGLFRPSTPVGALRFHSYRRSSLFGYKMPLA